MRKLVPLILLLPSLAYSQVIPTSEWISVWSDGTTFNQSPVPLGAVVRAFDPQGILCGEYTVTTEGSYGLMPVYRDDPFTPMVDEGAEPGDELRFEIDGIPARILGPDEPTWSFNGDVKKINLAYEQVIPTTEWVSFWSDASTINGIPIPDGTIVRAYDPQGVLCGEFEVAVPGSYGLMPVYRDDPTTTSVDEGADLGDVISFTMNGAPASAQGPDDAVWSMNGAVKKVDLQASIVATLLQSSRIAHENGTVLIEWQLNETIDERSCAILRRGISDGAYHRVDGSAVRSGSLYFFEDHTALPGETYWYMLSLSLAGGEQMFILGSIIVPSGKLLLYQNKPNPFAQSTTFTLEVDKSSSVSLTILDVQGRVVRHLMNAEMRVPDVYAISWDGRSDNGAFVPSGVYFARLAAGGKHQVKKITIIR